MVRPSQLQRHKLCPVALTHHLTLIYWHYLFPLTYYYPLVSAGAASHPYVVVPTPASTAEEEVEEAREDVTSEQATNPEFAMGVIEIAIDSADMLGSRLIQRLIRLR